MSIDHYVCFISTGEFDYDRDKEGQWFFYEDHLGIVKDLHAEIDNLQEINSNYADRVEYLQDRYT